MECGEYFLKGDGWKIYKQTLFIQITRDIKLCSARNEFKVNNPQKMTDVLK